MDNLIQSITYIITKYNEDTHNSYTNQKILEQRIEELLLESKGQMINRCIECGCDMGECNPRQFCGKLKCLAL